MFSLLQVIINSLILYKFFTNKYLDIEGDKFYHVIITYSIIFISLNLILLSFHKNNKILTYSRILFFSFIFSMYLFETFLRFQTNEIISKYDYYLSLKKNSNVTLAVPPMYHFENKELFSLSGIANTRTILCNENGYYSEYNSDRYGFNNPDYVWEDTSTTFLIIGDSFAHGACVNRPHDLASVIREKTKKNTKSIAYGDNGPLIELASLIEFVTKETKFVLWFYYEGNDLEGIEKEKENQILIKYLNQKQYSQKIKNRQSEVDSAAKIIIENEIARIKQQKKKQIGDGLLNQFKSFLRLELLRDSFIIRKITHPKNTNELFNIISYAKKITSDYGSNFVFIYLPEFSRYTQKSYDNFNYIKIKEKFENSDTLFIDANNLFLKNNAISLFAEQKPGSHYTIEGYELLGNFITSEINEKFKY